MMFSIIVASRSRAVCPALRPIREALVKLDSKPISQPTRSKKPSLVAASEEKGAVSCRYPSAHLIGWRCITRWSRRSRRSLLSAMPSHDGSAASCRSTLFTDGQKTPAGKQPYAIVGPDGLPLAMAGLWERWKDRSTGDTVQTFTIVTTVAPSMIDCSAHSRRAL
jgi:hypothetical protein